MMARRTSGSSTKGRLLAAEAASRPEFWAKVNLLGSCWEWTGATTEWGYGKLGYRGHDFTAHRCSYEYAFGRLPDGMWVLHKCDNPPCINPSHLFLGAAKDNTADMYAKGRAPRIGAKGATNRHARLTDDEALQIRLDFAAGARPKDLADQYGIGSSVVNRVIRGVAWRHVGGPICTADRRGLTKRKAA